MLQRATKNAEKPSIITYLSGTCLSKEPYMIPTQSHDLAKRNHVGQQPWIIILFRLEKQPHYFTKDVSIVECWIWWNWKHAVDIDSAKWIGLRQQFRNFYVRRMLLEQVHIMYISSQESSGSTWNRRKTPPLWSSYKLKNRKSLRTVINIGYQQTQVYVQNVFKNSLLATVGGDLPTPPPHW